MLTFQCPRLLKIVFEIRTLKLFIIFFRWEQCPRGAIRRSAHYTKLSKTHAKMSRPRHQLNFEFLWISQRWECYRHTPKVYFPRHFSLASCNIHFFIKEYFKPLLFWESSTLPHRRQVKKQRTQAHLIFLKNPFIAL